MTYNAHSTTHVDSVPLMHSRTSEFKTLTDVMILMAGMSTTVTASV